MAKNSIKLSPKHGVNPSMLICPLCKKEQGIALMGKLKNDEKAPLQIYGEPCQECMEEVVKNNRVLVIGIDEKNNGIVGFVVVNREAFGEALPEDEHVAPMHQSDFKELYNLVNSNKNDDNNI